MKYINVTELEIIFELIINKLKDEELKDVEIDTDLYRYVPTDKWASFETDVIEEGSLFDDVDSLKLLVSDPDRPCTYVDFDRVASLLRAISQKNNPL